MIKFKRKEKNRMKSFRSLEENEMEWNKMIKGKEINEMEWNVFNEQKGMKQKEIEQNGMKLSNLV